MDVVNFFGGSGLLAFPQAVGQTLGNTSPLVAPILKAPVTAYAYNPKEDVESVEDVFATGSQLSLISALQARNAARFVVLGSLESLQDKWFDASVKTPDGKSVKTVNREFAKQLTEWTFKEVGVLKVLEISHHQIAPSSKQGENTTQIGDSNPEIYRIKNDVVCCSSHWSQLVLGLANNSSRNLPLKSPNGPTHTGLPLLSHPQMLFSLNLACSPLSSASHSPLLPSPPTARSTPLPSPHPTSTVSSPSK